MTSIGATSRYGTGDNFQRIAQAAGTRNAESFDALIGRNTSGYSSATSTTADTGAVEEPYNFSDMTRQDIAAAGSKLFQQGKITLDELFRFDHPDGILRIAADGSSVILDPDDRIDFIAETRNAIHNMELTGEARRSGSSYDMMVGLLAKLTETL